MKKLRPTTYLKSQGHSKNNDEPYNRKVCSPFRMKLEVFNFGRRKEAVIPSRPVSQSATYNLNACQSTKHKPSFSRPPLLANSPHSDDVSQRVEHSYSQRNVNSRRVINKAKHYLKVGGLLLIRQHLVIALAAAGITAHADEHSAKIKSLMHSLVLEYAKISPFMSDKSAFESEKGKKVVRQSLKVLNNKIQNSELGEETAHGPGFKISYHLLSDFISGTEKIFNSGELEYARMRINGLGNVCVSCHMQSPKISSFSAFEFVTDKSSEKSFSNANFLFVIRRYDEALDMIDALIRGFPKTKISADQLNEAYRQKISILVRFFGDPDLTIKSLEEDLKNKELGIDIQQNIKSWLDAANGWKKEKEHPEKMSGSELIKYAEKEIPSDLDRKISPANPQLLKLLRISGLLYNQLFDGKSGAQTQAMLYWLARCERSLAPLYWYSLNEIYLKECVMQFPKKPYTKRCFEAYKQGMEERYLGKKLPEEIQNSVEVLKKYL